MRPYTFPMIRLQVIELIDDDPIIVKAVCELSLLLVMRYLHRDNGACAVTDEKLAERKGWTVDKVSRTVKTLARSELFDVRRGRWLRATEYNLSEAAWSEATSRRNAAHKITNLAERQTPEKSESYSGKISGLTPHKHPPFKKYKQQKGEPISEPSSSNFVHIPDRSFPAQQWNECLRNSGWPELGRMFATSQVHGKEGFWVPSEYPSIVGSSGHVAQLKLLQKLCWFHSSTSIKLSGAS